MQETLRLELLKLVHRHDQSAETAIERAKVLEAYVTDAKAAPSAPAERPILKVKPKPTTVNPMD